MREYECLVQSHHRQSVTGDKFTKSRHCTELTVDLLRNGSKMPLEAQLFHRPRSCKEKKILKLMLTRHLRVPFLDFQHLHSVSQDKDSSIQDNKLKQLCTFCQRVFYNFKISVRSLDLEPLVRRPPLVSNREYFLELKA